SMISTHWLNQRTPYWRRLEELLDRTQTGGVKALARDELRVLGRLYRQIAADLATVREDAGSVRFAAYLNQLLARAHNTIYSADRPTSSGLVRFFRTTFPATFRENAGLCTLALVLFVLGGIIGAALTIHDPDFKLKLLGPEMVDTINRREMWTHSIVGVKPLASSRIMTNNIGV